MENVEQYLPLLEKLASKLGTSAEYLWTVLLKQAPISAFLDMVEYLIIAVVCIISCKLSIFTHKKISKGDWDDEAYIPLGVVVIVAIMLAAVAFFSFQGTVTKLINPEYWALKEVIKSVK